MNYPSSQDLIKGPSKVFHEFMEALNLWHKHTLLMQASCSTQQPAASSGRSESFIRVLELLQTASNGANSSRVLTELTGTAVQAHVQLAAEQAVCDNCTAVYQRVGHQHRTLALRNNSPRFNKHHLRLETMHQRLLRTLRVVTCCATVMCSHVRFLRTSTRQTLCSG